MKKVVVGFVLLFMSAACGQPYVDNTSDNLDTGWVKVWNNDEQTYKRCDGSTLVYSDGNGLTALNNSSECSYG